MGFNSCYHITDLPTFVSGNHLVLFDPHVRHLPNISSSNPGKKINFVENPIPAEYDDQVIPFRTFGCDMRKRYDATIFRFPLRSELLAEQSSISKQVCLSAAPGRVGLHAVTQLALCSTCCCLLPAVCTGANDYTTLRTSIHTQSLHQQ